MIAWAQEGNVLQIIDGSETAIVQHLTNDGSYDLYLNRDKAEKLLLTLIGSRLLRDALPRILQVMLRVEAVADMPILEMAELTD